MTLPKPNQADQKIGAPQKGTFRRRCPTKRNVISATGSGMATIQHEFFGNQARLPCIFVELSGPTDQRLPISRGMDVDFDDTRIWGHGQHFQPRVTGWGITLKSNRLLNFLSNALNHGNQADKILELT